MVALRGVSSVQVAVVFAEIYRQVAKALGIIKHFSVLPRSWFPLELPSHVPSFMGSALSFEDQEWVELPSSADLREGRVVSHQLRAHACALVILVHRPRSPEDFHAGAGDVWFCLLKL
jgi:hypothetical protein